MKELNVSRTRLWGNKDEVQIPEPATYLTSSAMAETTRARRFERGGSPLG